MFNKWPEMASQASHDYSLGVINKSVIIHGYLRATIESSLKQFVSCIQLYN